MSTRVFQMWKYFMKFMVINLQWLTRTIETWLEAMDEPNVPNLERPIINKKQQEKHNDANEQGRNHIPLSVDKDPDPVPAKNQTDPIGKESTATPICPLCDRVMQLKPAHKGGWFYGCSQWPACKGYRNKHDKGPGPAAAILKLRNTVGEAAWEEMDKKKRNGTFGLNKCWFCGMDPCDHVGRNCPKRGVNSEGQANDHI